MTADRDGGRQTGRGRAADAGPGDARAEPGRLGWLIVFGFCTLFALFNAANAYLSFFAQGLASPWWRVLAWQLLSMNVWALLAPLVLRLALRLPLTREKWGRAVLAHLAAGVVFAALHMTAYAAITLWLDPVPRARPETFGRILSTLVRVWLHVELLIYWAIVGISHTLAYHHKYRAGQAQAARLREELTRLELQTLRSQLQPHFLFNTLNSIAGLMRAGDAKTAVGMVVKLSDLLRGTLKFAEVQEVPLREELEMLSNYVGILRLRFSDWLDVRLQVDPAALPALVPSFVLQPLVENAVRHGIEQRETPGLIEVTAARANGDLLIEVSDNGPGLPAGWPESSPPGVGLSNTRARLRRIYGDDERFQIGPRAGGGVSVRLRLPFRPAPAADPAEASLEQDQSPHRR